MTEERIISTEPTATTERWRDFDLSGRSAVVTGGARGIGRAIAHRLAGLGARTVIWDIDEGQLERTGSELTETLSIQGRPNDVAWARVDVTSLDAVMKAASAFAAGGLDILVNNAGTTSVQAADSMAEEVWHKTVALNLTGTYFSCRAAIPYLQRSDAGSIVNISSSSAMVGGGGGVHYAASKAGVDGMTRQLARELAPRVRVNSIQPRTIETELFRARYAHAPEEREGLLKKIPVGRFGQPEDIADAVAFLASDWASFITGQVLLIDGGRTYQ